MTSLAKLLGKKPYTLKKVVSYIENNKININQNLSTLMYDEDIITSCKYTKHVCLKNFLLICKS